MEKGINEEIELLPEVQASIDHGMLTITGAKGENKKNFHNPLLQLSIEGNKIKILSKRFTKREKKLLGTFRAHIKNMMKGVKEGCIYNLKICSSHFPMNVSINNKELIVKNFFGEKHPRKILIKEGAEIKINGSEIEISSCDKEIAGQVAADIENATRISGRDRRIFQDGIFITKKDGKRM